jgi:hypothetical protein
MPWVCLTYLVMRIDVNNITNAAIINTEQGHGIKKDLHLSPQQWTWVVVGLIISRGSVILDEHILGLFLLPLRGF